MKKTMKNRITRLDALAWKAKELGVSYGHLSAATTPEEQKEIFLQYTALVAQKTGSEPAKEGTENDADQDD